MTRQSPGALTCAAMSLCAALALATPAAAQVTSNAFVDGVAFVGASVPGDSDIVATTGPSPAISTPIGGAPFGITARANVTVPGDGGQIPTTSNWAFVFLEVAQPLANEYRFNVRGRCNKDQLYPVLVSTHVMGTGNASGSGPARFRLRFASAAGQVQGHLHLQLDYEIGEGMLDFNNGPNSATSKLGCTVDAIGAQRVIAPSIGNDLQTPVTIGSGGFRRVVNTVPLQPIPLTVDAAGTDVRVALEAFYQTANNTSFDATLTVRFVPTTTGTNPSAARDSASCSTAGDLQVTGIQRWFRNSASILVSGSRADVQLQAGLPGADAFGVISSTSTTLPLGSLIWPVAPGCVGLANPAGVVYLGPLDSMGRLSTSYPLGGSMPYQVGLQMVLLDLATGRLAATDTWLLNGP